MLSFIFLSLLISLFLFIFFSNLFFILILTFDFFLFLLTFLGLLPKPHQSFLIQFLLVVLDSHQALNWFLFSFIHMRGQFCKTNIFPKRFFFVTNWVFDNLLNACCVFWIQPEFYFRFCEHCWHSLMDMVDIGCRILS